MKNILNYLSLLVLTTSAYRELDTSIYYFDTTLRSSLWMAANDIQRTADQGFIMTGLSIAADFSEYKMLVFKLNAVGQLEWARSLGIAG